MAKSLSIQRYSHSYFSIKKIILGIILLLILSMSIYYLTLPNLSAIANTQLATIRDNDLQKAYAMTTTAFQEQTPFSQFKEYLDTYSVLRQNKALETNETIIDGDFAYLRGTLTAQDNSKMMVEYQFIKEDKQWKIQAIRLSQTELPLH